MDRTLEDLHAHRVEQEPEFTDRLLARLEDQFDGRRVHGISWRAKTLTSRGPLAQERRVGADFCGVASIRLPEYRVAKGFLAQAKMIDVVDRPPSEQEYHRLQSQCQQMLRVTPDAYVFLYGRHAVTVVAAVSVVSAQRCNPHELFTKSAAGFFQDHFECFIGDPRISATSMQELERLVEEYDLRHGYILEARGEEQNGEPEAGEHRR